jgi:flagellar biosynthesis protein FliP
MSRVTPYPRGAAAAAFILFLLLMGAGGSAAGMEVSDPTPPSLIPQIPGINPNGTPVETASAIQILFLITVLSLAPSILILMTCFTRIIIVLSFLRRALATQSLPPNQVIIGLSLYLTFAIMAPVFQQANRDGLQPYLAKEIDQKTALERAAKPFRKFMLQHTRRKDLRLFVGLDKELSAKVLANGGRVDPEQIPTLTIIPAFTLSEMKIAFWMGFLLYLPFLIIDLVVASVLMSMGMMFLPPVMVSIPFKLLLFVLVDGWYLVIGELVRSIGPVT